ncbi:MAG: hypothetical protein GC182_08660 [Rhodopseudomonas sp.]|nr:hypothetical protein [Rhodopseudomonas sp.]
MTQSRDLAVAAKELTLVAQRWCASSTRSTGPAPAGAALDAMLGELTQRLCWQQLTATAIACESWQRPQGLTGLSGCDFLARMTVTAVPGLPTRSFRSWFQWRHVQWRWSSAPFPAAISAINALQTDS